MMSQRDTMQEAAQPGERADLATFAVPRWWSGTEGHDLEIHPLEASEKGAFASKLDEASGQWHVGLEWQEPRDVREVLVRFAGAVPDDLVVQYWRKNWPTIQPERMPGARRGWIGRDDRYHGTWTTVRAERRVDGRGCTFIFDPIDLPELAERGAEEQLNQAEDYLARFRRTLRIRVASAEEMSPVTGLAAHSTACWETMSLDVHLGVGVVDEGSNWSGSVEVFNGHLLQVEGLGFGDDEEIKETGWVCNQGANGRVVRLTVLCTDSGSDSWDRTLVTVRTQARSFSFLTADVAKGPMYIEPYGVFVCEADAGVSFQSFLHAQRSMPASIYDRVTDEGEQSFERARAEIPALDVTKQAPYGLYMPLGVEAGRQEFAMRYNGELFLDKAGLKLSGRDAARLIWPSSLLRFRIGSGDPPDYRERDGTATKRAMLDNWLPIPVNTWLDREIEYEQTTFAAPLRGGVQGPAESRGDEDLVALMRIVIRNTTHGVKRAQLRVSIAPEEMIEVHDGHVVALGRVVPGVPVIRQWRVDSYDEPVLRCAVDTGGAGQLRAVSEPVDSEGPANVPNAVVYEVDLAGGMSQTLLLAFPFTSFTKDSEWEEVAGLDFDAKLAEVVGYWEDYVGAGGHMLVPDREIRDFHKACRTHVAIAVDKDPVNGLYSVPAATWRYGVCANEACWQIHMLDQAGHHDRAEAYLETYLATQGDTELDGLFETRDGVMQGVDLDFGKPKRSGFSYNLDPGVIMETMARHYWLSGDRAWLGRVADQLVAACDFVIREREATKVAGPDGQPDQAWGLMPVGHLEDNPEWRHWFAVNAHAYSGMAMTAEALADIEHPEADRLATEAEEYRRDIRQAARRCMVEAPVVRLLDGTYVPQIPTRTHIRGREWGWFRQAAYGAIHLLEGFVFEPWEEEMTWVLQDLEDNLFVSRDWGRPVDLQTYWFSHGGITIQPNLTDQAINYLRRGQIRHGLRALFNNFGVSLYRDVPVFTEHPVIALDHGVGPFYKTSDEAKALSWLREFLIHEEDSELHLAMGAPRAWLSEGVGFSLQDMATFFGPLSYTVTPSADKVVIDIELQARRDVEALAVHVRLPEGKRVMSAAVEGGTLAMLDEGQEVVRITEPAQHVCLTVDTR